MFRPSGSLEGQLLSLGYLFWGVFSRGLGREPVVFCVTYKMWFLKVPERTKSDVSGVYSSLNLVCGS